MSDNKTKRVNSWLPANQSDIEETVKDTEWKYRRFVIINITKASGNYWYEHNLVSELTYSVSTEEFQERLRNYRVINPDAEGTPSGLATDRKLFDVKDTILDRGLRKMIDKIDAFYKMNPHLQG